MMKEVFHGTTMRRMQSFFEPGANEDLFGIRYPGFSSVSSTLTNSVDYATTCAIAAMVRDNSRVKIPLILHFSIPTEHLVDEGIVMGHDKVHGFSTNILVQDHHQLPEWFLRNLNMTIEEAIRKFARREIEAYRIPRAFYTHFQLIDRSDT